MKQKNLILGVCLFGIAALVACGGDKKDKDEKTADNGAAKKIELVKSFYPLFEKGDWAGIEKITSADFTEHSSNVTGGMVSSRDSLINGLKMFHDAFPDMKFEVQHAAADGDFVFVHYKFTGTNTGAMMGNPANNKKVEYMGVDVVQVKDSVGVAHWDYADNVSFMRQMGMMQ